MGIKVADELFSGTRRQSEQLRSILASHGFVRNDPCPKLSKKELKGLLVDADPFKSVTESTIWASLMGHAGAELMAQNKLTLLIDRLHALHRAAEHVTPHVLDALLYAADDPKALADSLFSCAYAGTGRATVSVPEALQRLAELDTKKIGGGCDIGRGELLLVCLLSTDVRWYANNAREDVTICGFKHHVKSITSRNAPARGGLRSWNGSDVHLRLMEGFRRGVMQGDPPHTELTIAFVQQNAKAIEKLFGSLQAFSDLLSREGRELGMPGSDGMIFLVENERTLEFVPTAEVHVARVSQGTHKYTMVRDKMIKDVDA